MARIETWLDCDVKKPIKVQHLAGNLFSLDNGGNLIGVNVKTDGEDLALSGTITGNIIRADGGTVSVAGYIIDGNKAYIVLPQSAYAVVGAIAIIIKNISGGVTTTLAACTTVVYRSSTDISIDPGTIIPSITELIADIEAAVATIPADYSSLCADVDYLDSDIKHTNELLLIKHGGTNLFPQLASNEYISDYYLVNGSVSSNDSLAYINKYIPVNSNTTYTMRLVPVYGSATTPFYYTTNPGEYYDENKNFIGNISHTSGTFTTPYGAKYIRINVSEASGITRSRLNDRCMLTLGSSIPESYVAYSGADEYLEGTQIVQEIEDANDLIEDRTLYQTVNKYNPALQTSETISPHYWYNGAPYSTTDYDANYNCTAPIEILPDTQYTIGLIPGYTRSSHEYTVPWSNSEQSVFYYDENNNYIGRKNSSGGSFTTPANAKYIRFNYETPRMGLGLNALNATCMLVVGNTLPSEFVGYVYETVKERIEDLNEEIGSFEETQEVVDLLLGDYEIIYSPNYYDKSKQTPSTISPHYFVDGVPYSGTQFDTSWNCTAPIEVEAGVQYTVGLVPPATGDIVKPWAHAASGLFFYDSDGNYISGTTNNTFTTPAGTKTIRFNYYIANGTVSLGVLNASCMLVKGSTLPETYQAYGDKIECDLMEKIDSIAKIGISYKFSGSDILISYGYNSQYDAVIVMNAGRANGLFDFAKFCLKPVDTPLSECETGSLIVVWSSSTDMHSPFKFNAVNNPDGYHYDATSPGFVGGNHTLDQMGSDYKTASSRYVNYYADGKPVSSGYGQCNNFEVRWANNVQAYNCVKQGGGGRTSLIEYHDIVFDGVQFNETVKLVPTEDIKMYLWYGFQFLSWGSKYTNIRFIEGSNRAKYTSGNVNSGKLLTSGMDIWGNDHEIIMTVDNYYDLGERTYVTSMNYGAFTSGEKGYFNIINNNGSFVMSNGEAYYLRGSYRFLPAINT